jgi:hypothetical protein
MSHETTRIRSTREVQIHNKKCTLTLHAKTMMLGARCSDLQSHISLHEFLQISVGTGPNFEKMLLSTLSLVLFIHFFLIQPSL